MPFDYESFLVGVQVGRRLKVADANRRLEPKPVDPGLLILAEDGTPIITEYYHYAGNVSFFNCNERFYAGRAPAFQEDAYYELRASYGEEGVRFFYAIISGEPKMVLVKDNLSGGEYRYHRIWVNYNTGVERDIATGSLIRTNMFYPAEGSSTHGYVTGPELFDVPGVEIEPFEGTAEELEAFVASGGYKYWITEDGGEADGQ